MLLNWNTNDQIIIELQDAGSALKYICCSCVCAQFGEGQADADVMVTELKPEAEAL
jgi:hypothetical protein